jgi:citrate synthase
MSIALFSRETKEVAMPIGLDDTIAAETTLSDVDGLSGRLVVRGLPLAQIAGRMRAEDMLAHLWSGLLDELPADLPAAIGRARTDVWARLEPHLANFAVLPTFDAVRAALALLPDDLTTAGALRLAAAPAVLVPAFVRLAAGDRPLAPDPTLGHAADVLSMLGNRAADHAEAAALDAYLVTVADHGLNASTFTARIVASTGAGFGSAVLAAMGALKGPLHGGAPGPVLDMLDAVGSASAAEDWVRAELASGRRLMGFGHRIYRVRDPRADALRAALVRLRNGGGGDDGRLALADAVERAALEQLAARKPQRPLATNVEFMTALLLEALGFPREAFAAVFAMGRVVGWLAHAREQAISGRLIRPQSRYVGPQPRQAA